ncbi:unnamed protein product [Brassica oleracea]
MKSILVEAEFIGQDLRSLVLFHATKPVGFFSDLTSNTLFFLEKDLRFSSSR